MEVKAAVWLALRRAVAAAGVACRVLPDGAPIRVDDRTDYEPDAVVYAGERMPPDGIAVPEPLIVVEALSPSTRALDTGLKLSDCFRLPSTRHCLIVRAGAALVTHRRRDGDSGSDTRILRAGDILLDPPCIAVAVEAFDDP